MSDVDQAREQLRLSCVATRERLIDELARRRFVELSNVQPSKWRGVVALDESRQTAVEVTIPHDYPYQAPWVVPLSRAVAESVLRGDAVQYHEATSSWHLERGGRMCLFEADDHTSLPWADARRLFDQVQAWLVQDAAGWPDDHPALDLERYLKGADEVLVYDELDHLLGQVVRLDRRKQRLLFVGRPLKVPRGTRGMRGPWRGDVALILDVGEVTAPIRDWDSLLTAAGSQAAKLSAEVEQGARTVVVRYSRADASGVLALRLTRPVTTWTLHALQTAPADTATLRRRAHPELDTLADKRVAIVGVGAVGSVLADLLHRSGVGTLHLQDADTVLPGNLVRHLVNRAHIGDTKAHAVAATIDAARPGSRASIATQNGRLDTLDDACALLSGVDLVVDATADSTASPILAAAARAGAGRLVSVAVLADGYAVRVDHIPGQPPHEIPLPPRREGSYETGCSSPVSTTPPAAAWEAAAIGARHTIDALLGLTPTNETRILRPAATS